MWIGLPSRVAKQVRAIVIGIDGAVGGELYRALATRCARVIGTSRRPDRGAGVLRLDLCESGAVDAELPPADVAFFCAGLTGFSECEAQPETARLVNAIAPAALAARLAGRGTRVVLLSTGAVVRRGGARMPGALQQRADSVYARSKGEAEQRFMALGRSASVLRLSKVLSPNSSLFNGWICALSQGLRIAAFEDLRLSPLAAGHAVEALIAIAEHRADGLFQASGAADISYADAARHLARRLGVPETLVDVTTYCAGGEPGVEPAASETLDARRLFDLCGFAGPLPAAVIDAVYGRSISAAQAAVPRAP